MSEEPRRRVFRLATSCVCVALLAGSLRPATALDTDIFHQRLQEALALTVAQEDSMRFLRADLEADLALLRQAVLEGELLAIEGRLRYRALVDSYRVAREQVLTFEQVELLRRAQALARQRIVSDGQPPEEPPANHLPELLDLTTDQVTRWRDLLARQRAEVAAIREAGEQPSPEDYRRLRESHQIAFEAMLTAEQRLALEQARHRWRMARILADTMPDSLASDEDLPFPDDTYDTYDDQAPLDDVR